jgi:glucose/mannose-6-phosphate isomerase
MNLDDPNSFAALDSTRLLSRIDALPAQLLQGWALGQSNNLPGRQKIRQVLVAGMGGSATAGDLLSTWMASSSPAPVWIHRDYELPAWAEGPETLVIASSASGDTEETLRAFEIAHQRRCLCLALTSGGRLAQTAASSGAVLWKMPPTVQANQSIGLTFGMMAALFARLGLIDISPEQLIAAEAAMLGQQQAIQPQTPAALNPAKRLAGQLIERQVVLFASGILAPVARRWKNQINQLDKAWAQVEILPEADHNSIAGTANPEQFFTHVVMLFLRAASENSQNLRRLDLTRQAMMLEGVNTDFFNAQGESALEQIWTCLHFGDYVAYYLAMAYGLDPGPSAWIEGFKKEIQIGG